MKVKYLIRRLKLFNPEAEVRLNDYNGESALFVNARLNDCNVVWINGENDVNMKEEINARFQYATEKDISSFDLYRNLLVDGITVDMVRKYMGDDTADHMKEFCVENGLL